MSDLVGALLRRHGLVKPAELAAAHALRDKDGGSFGECLVRIGAIDEAQLVEFYHKRLMVPRIPDAKLLIVSPKVLSLVPSDMAAEFRVVPVEVDAEGTLTLAMADPSDNHAVDEVGFFAGHFVVRSVATESAIRRAIEAHYGVRFSSPPASQRPGAPPVIVDVLATTRRAKSAPTSEPKPTREQLDQQIVLLTRVKRSEETPLPFPVPPPLDTPAPAPAPSAELVPEQSEPILLTKPKRSTSPQMPAVTPDPPLLGLREVGARDAIAALVLDYVSLLARRTLFFVIKKDLLTGQDARGEGLDSATIKQVAINIEAPSIFRDVIASRLPYRGPLPETPANRAFAATIGGIEGEILLMPIAIRDRIIAVLYADRARGPLPDASLHATTREAGLAFERLILSAKGR